MAYFIFFFFFSFLHNLPSWGKSLPLSFLTCSGPEWFLPTLDAPLRLMPGPFSGLGLMPECWMEEKDSMSTVSCVASLCSRNPWVSFPGTMVSAISLKGGRHRAVAWLLGMRKAVWVSDHLTPHSRCSLPEVPGTTNYCVVGIWHCEWS